LHDNIVNIFKKLKKDNKIIGIVSNSMRRTIKLYFDKYEINVDFIFSKDDADCQKYKDEYWQVLIKKHHLNPKECLVIGDHQHDDVTMPKKFGFKTMLIKNPHELKNILKN
ncbi:MAG: HAD family hydrolase, partial [Nanoarchaeota archaeon]|nr:HAD family hydrolase [Nanoarchaeota archaeon]